MSREPPGIVTDAEADAAPANKSKPPTAEFEPMSPEMDVGANPGEPRVFAEADKPVDSQPDALASAGKSERAPEQDICEEAAGCSIEAGDKQRGDARRGLEG